ncbi:MAG TPA: hypothetical protein VMD91_13435 [Candidatus Sulfotelmatobacter sp.]|nr:hypothetical protein [Candidatus Sulfotelmatobacter sp.]
MQILSEWSNFYVIIGSSAAALTGLMFVVITLVSHAQTTREGLSTFSTPTIVFFCKALFVAAVLAAPWHALVTPAILLVLSGAFGTGYSLRILMRSRRLQTYQPDAEDVIWYWTLPMLASLAIVAGAAALPLAARQALFTLGASSLLLIFVGIHNAWDVVTYIAIDFVKDDGQNQGEG